MNRRGTAEVFRSLRESETVAINDLARSLGQQGKDVINLGGGEPDFDTPAHIVEAASEALRSGMTHYVNSPGIPELRAAIAGKLQQQDGARYELSQIIVTPGGKMALYIALMTLLDPGDEVIVLEPAWVSYEPMIILAGGRAARVRLDPADDYRMTARRIAGQCAPRTRAIVVNTPNNPTGRVMTAAEIAELAEVAKAYDLAVISDEVYDQIVFGNPAFTCVASHPDLIGRTVTIQSFSKGYAMTGWRLGYLALPAARTGSACRARRRTSCCSKRRRASGNACDKAAPTAGDLFNQKRT